MPAFAYKNLANDAPTYAMTADNAAPALLVWLYLLVDPVFLTQLQQAGSVANVVFKDVLGYSKAIGDISTQTRLSKDTVIAIIDKGYMQSDNATKQAFSTVSKQFQALVQLTVDPTNWQPGECPSLEGIEILATNGVQVDPAATALASRKVG